MACDSQNETRQTQGYWCSSSAVQAQIYPSRLNPRIANAAFGIQAGVLGAQYFRSTPMTRP